MNVTNEQETEQERKLEVRIQRELAQFLKDRGWQVERMLADAYQNGIPDLYCHHRKWGSRWVEVKRPDHYSFTKAQRRKRTHPSAALATHRVRSQEACCASLHHCARHLGLRQRVVAWFRCRLPPGSG